MNVAQNLWNCGKHFQLMSVRETIIGRQSEGSIIRGFVNQKWVPYSQRYLFNAIPDTNHNAKPTNPNRYSKGNPNPTNPTNPNTRYRIIEPSDYRYITMGETLWNCSIQLDSKFYYTSDEVRTTTTHCKQLHW